MWYFKTAKPSRFSSWSWWGHRVVDALRKAEPNTSSVALYGYSDRQEVKEKQTSFSHLRSSRNHLYHASDQHVLIPARHTPTFGCAPFTSHPDVRGAPSATPADAWGLRRSTWTWTPASWGEVVCVALHSTATSFPLRKAGHLFKSFETEETVLHWRLIRTLCVWMRRHQVISDELGVPDWLTLT